MAKYQIRFVPDESVRESMSSYLNPGFVKLHGDHMTLQEVDSPEMAGAILKQWIDIAPMFAMIGTMDNGFAEALVCRVLHCGTDEAQLPRLKDALFFMPWSSNCITEKYFFKEGKTAINKFRGPPIKIPGAITMVKIAEPGTLTPIGPVNMGAFATPEEVAEPVDLDEIIIVDGRGSAADFIFFDPAKPIEVGAIRTTDGKLWNMDQADEAAAHQRIINARAAFNAILDPEWFRDIQLDTVLDLLSKNVDQLMLKLK